MSVHVFSPCWNEEIILPFFFKHYKSRFRDIKFTIYDNMSTDRSREIMHENGAEIIDNDTSGEIRMDRQMEIKNNCYKGSVADWIIVCDIDEFLDCNDTFLKSTDCTIVKAKGYQMVGNTYNLDKVILGYPSYRFNKCVLFKRNEIKAINYNPGSHSCKPEGNVIYNTHEVPLYHMKYFHPVYYVRRSMQNAKRVSLYNKQRNFSDHYTANIFRSINHYLKSRIKSKRVKDHEVAV